MDLGCGTGRDVYIASGLVGENGRVIGVDMTDEQLTVARSHIEYHREQFGYSKSNVEFLKANIDDLKTVGIEDNSVDIVISNCVINLTEDKRKVLSEIFRVLKPGGELFFSDMYADRRIPESVKGNKKAWGEGLTGALYTEDFRRIMKTVGFKEYRITKKREIEVKNPDLKKLVGETHYFALTVRAFKIDSLEDRDEDYQQEATYLGTIQHEEEEIEFDSNFTFEAQKTVKIDANTAEMLTKSRLGQFFKVSERGAH